MKMDRKTLLIIGGGVALVLFIMYIRGRSSGGSSSQPVDTQGTTASDYANLAGDMQSLQAQETGDIANLTAQEQAQAAQEAGDVSMLQAAVATAVTGPQGPAGPVGPAGAHGPAGQNAVKVAAGKKKQAPKKQQHPKAGVKHVNNPPGHHVAANHPAGTAGKAVAPRHHAVHAPPAVSTNPVHHPAVHSGSQHPSDSHPGGGAAPTPAVTTHTQPRRGQPAPAPVAHHNAPPPPSRQRPTNNRKRR